jgi:Glycosyltransferase like family
MPPTALPVSIVCVFNDADVRRRCLDRSIEEHRHEAEVEYLTVDNVDGSFATAGAALNYGASLASNDFVAFIHQDVYLHSLRALSEAAGVLAEDDRIGVVGAIGVDAGGRLVGRIRDRVVLLGEPAMHPTDVDSLDELLFMTRRSLVGREPLTESAELGWHAYAVEYGLRARSLGLRVCAVDLPLTHNSPSTNVDRLDAARDAVAAAYPDALPVRVPGGVIAGPSQPPARSKTVSRHGWRYRWLRESAAAHVGRLTSGTRFCVLGDIRLEIDELLAIDPDSSFLVINLDPQGGFADRGPTPLELIRRPHAVELTAEAMPGLIERLAERDPGSSTLLTNLTIGDLRDLKIAELRSGASYLDGQNRVLGFRREVGYWMLLGPAAAAAPQRWGSPRATPLGMPLPA